VVITCCRLACCVTASHSAEHRQQLSDKIMGQCCCEIKWMFEQRDLTSRSGTHVLSINASLRHTYLPVKAHVPAKCYSAHPRVLEASHVSRNGSIANHVYIQIGRTYWFVACIIVINGNDVPVHAIDAYWCNRGTVPLSLNFGTRWKWVVGYLQAPAALSPRKEPWYQLNVGLDGPHSWSAGFENR
jgi:hypothetical protein